MADLVIPERWKKLHDRVRKSSPQMGWSWTIPLFDDIARLEAEVKELRAQVERYEKPVSNEEINAYSAKTYVDGGHEWLFNDDAVNALVASRKEPTK